jgi:hypothetical protein
MRSHQAVHVTLDKVIDSARWILGGACLSPARDFL